MRIKLTFTIIALALLAACAGPMMQQAGCPHDPPMPTPWPEQPTLTSLPPCATATPTCRPTYTPVVEPSPTPYPTQVPCPTQPPPGPAGNTANPNASAETKAVLAYLTNLPQGEADRLVSGQQVGNVSASPFWKYYRPDIQLYEATGKQVALLGGSYRHCWLSDEEQDIANAKLNQILMEHWQNGGLVTIYWPADNPWSGRCQDSPRGGPLTDLITPGTAVHRVWMAKLDWIAGWLSQLRDAGVVVLWRPLQEMNGTWYWWADPDQQWPPSGNEEEYVALYRHMFDYFSHEKQLNNLLWVYSPYTWADDLAAKFPLTNHYPGDEYVDIIGPSYYLHQKDGQELGHLPASWEPLLALGKPIALGAFGPGCAGVGQLCSDVGKTFDCLEFIENLKGHCPEIVYFLFWGREWAIVEQENAAGLLSDSWVITRQEVDWR